MKESIEDKLIEIQCDGQVEAQLANIEGLQFIFRPLSYNEYAHAYKLLEITEADANEWILYKSILHPQPDDLKQWIDNSYGNAVDIISEYILEKSSFTTPEQIASLYKERLDIVSSDFMALMQVYICTVYPLDRDWSSKARFF